jgi:hypothetical protein
MSCLFDSLSSYITNINSNQLRNIICDYLLTNPTIFDNIDASNVSEWQTDLTLQEYVNKMRKDEEWGSGTELKSFANIFNIKVNVYHEGRIIEFLPLNNKPIGQIYLHYTGNHYTPIINNK